MSWTRIGATPQFLSTSVIGTACGDQFNMNPDTGCTTPSSRTILYLVEAVFDAAVFTSIPVVGTEIQTSPPCIFCTGEPGDACYQPFVEVINIIGNISLRSNVTLVQVQFQKLVVYSNGVIGNVTASFRTVPRYPKCTSSSSSRCLAPQNGITNNVDNYCTACLNDVAGLTLNLTSTVLFYDSPGSNPWDTRLYQNYRIFPATNHHSPYTTFYPLVTLPRLTDSTVLFNVQVPAVDEDGTAVPFTCRDQDPAVPCSNVDFNWGLQILIGNEGLSLNFHSDGTQTPDGGWLLSRRDDRCVGFSPNGSFVHLQMHFLSFAVC